MSADFTFVDTISASGEWTINIDHKEISRANCLILAECAVHDHLLGVDLAVEILSLLDRCRLCVGTQTRNLVVKKFCNCQWNTIRHAKYQSEGD